MSFKEAPQKTIALAVLGAGYSERFGSDDKLAALLKGKPVAHHLLEVIPPFPWAQKILICRPHAPWTKAYQTTGFELFFNENPQGGMLSSLHRAVMAARPEVSHLLLCLADMPFLSKAHLSMLLKTAAFENMIATNSENYQGPPALFPIEALRRLPLCGEGGARSLLQNACFIACPPSEVRDIDTQADLRNVSQ